MAYDEGREGQLMAKVKEDDATKSVSTGMGVGIALGVALGAALENVGLGIAIGVALGAGLGGAFHKKKSGP